MAGVGGNFNEKMAVREVVAGEAMFLRSEDNRNLIAAAQLGMDTGSEVGQREDGLFRFAAGGGSGADDEGIVAKRFAEGRCLGCDLKKLGRADR